MPFALIGFFLGTAYALSQKFTFPANCLKLNPYLYLSLMVVLCMVFARSAAMAFNRYLDHQIDAKNPRTAIREIPSGKITPKNAIEDKHSSVRLFFKLDSRYFFSVSWNYCTTLPSRARIDLETPSTSLPLLINQPHGNVTTKSCLFYDRKLP
jgi:DNA-directed RNA polymerase subunit K/omega